MSPFDAIHYVGRKEGRDRAYLYIDDDGPAMFRQQRDLRRWRKVTTRILD